MPRVSPTLKSGYNGVGNGGGGDCAGGEGVCGGWVGGKMHGAKKSPDRQRSPSAPLPPPSAIGIELN